MKSPGKISRAVASFIFAESGAGLAGYVLMLAVIAGGVAVAAGYAPQVEQQYREIASFVARIFAAVGGPP